MIGYVTLGSNDIPRTGAFYDAVLGEIGAKRQMDSKSFIAWSITPGTPMLGVIKPRDGESATAGNGVTVAIAVETRDDVDAVHRKAMELGAVDEGAPGLRGGTWVNRADATPASIPEFYGAYFRDPDGNKLLMLHKDFLEGLAAGRGGNKVTALPADMAHLRNHL